MPEKSITKLIWKHWTKAIDNEESFLPPFFFFFFTIRILIFYARKASRHDTHNGSKDRAEMDKIIFFFDFKLIRRNDKLNSDNLTK